MIQLHYTPSSAAMAPHMVMQELGIPFELVMVDTASGEHQRPAYRKLNPNGLIPVLVDGDMVLYESAAICLHLSDTHPEGALFPAMGSVKRAHAYKWLSWMSTTLQQTLLLYFYPQRWADTPEAIAQVKAHAEQKVVVLLEQIDTQLASHGGPWMLGDAYSLIDIYGTMLCRWTRNFSSRKAREFAHIGPWLQRVLQRPAVHSVFTREGLEQPWV